MSDDKDNELDEDMVAGVMAMLTGGAIVEAAMGKVDGIIATNRLPKLVPGSPLRKLAEGAVWAGIGSTVEYMVKNRLLSDDPEVFRRFRESMGV